MKYEIGDEVEVRAFRGVKLFVSQRYDNQVVLTLIDGKDFCRCSVQELNSECVSYRPLMSEDRKK